MSSSEATTFFVTGGTLSSSARSYIEREADQILFDSLLTGQFCFVLNSRQMGKSSLCVRTMERLTEAGVRTAFVDLTRIGGRNVTPDQWYAGLLGELGRKLELRAELLTYWKENEDLGPMQRLFSALRNVVLERIPGQVAVFIDEIDATRSLSFDKDEFFAGVRECYNRRVEDPEYGRITFCMLGVALPNDLISNPLATPFNIGRRVYLKDFTAEEAKGFAAGIQRPGAEALVDRVYYWTHGHPYLTQSVCSAVALADGVRAPADVDELIRRDLFEPKSRETNINLADVANRALNAGAADPDPSKFKADLLSLYQRARNGKFVTDDESNRVAALLKLSGLMRSEDNRLVVRNRIYEHVFDREWIRENMPMQEMRRQRRAFWLGAIRVGFGSAVIVGIIGGLAISNRRLAVVAEAARDRAEYEAYVSKVNLMRTADDDNDRRLLAGLLTSTAESPYRGLEWDYWNAQLHDTKYWIPEPTGNSYVGIAPDSRSVVVGDFDNNRGQILSLPDLKPLSDKFFASTQTGFYRYDDKWWALATPRTDTIDRRDPITGKVASERTFPGLSLNRTAVSPDHRLLATVWITPDKPFPGIFRLLSSSDFSDVAQFEVPQRAMDSPRLSTDGTRVAFYEREVQSSILGDSALATVRETRTGRLLDEVRPVTVTAAVSAALSPDGKLLAAGDGDGRFVIRDIATKRTVFEKTFPHFPDYAVFSGDSAMVAIDFNQRVQVWDWRHNRMLFEHGIGYGWDFSLSGRYLACVGNGTNAYDLDGGDGAKSYKPERKATAVYPAANPDEVVIRTSLGAEWIDPQSMTARENPLKSSPRTTGYSADAEYVLTSSQDGEAQLIEGHSGKTLFHLTDTAVFTTIGHSPDGERILILPAASPLIALMYDRSGKLLAKTPLEGLYPNNNITCNHAGTLFACATDSGLVTLIGRDGKKVRDLKGPLGWPICYAFDTEDRRLAVGYQSTRVLIFQADGSGTPVECAGNSGTLINVQFNHRGDRLLTASSDGSVRLWDTWTGRQVLRLQTESGRQASAVLTRDEKAILVVYPNGEVKRLELTPREATQ